MFANKLRLENFPKVWVHGVVFQWFFHFGFQNGAEECVV